MFYRWGESARAGAHPRQLAERYSGTVGTGASGWAARAERSMATAAYAMTPVTTQRISVRRSPSILTNGKAATVPTIPPSVSPTATAGAKRPELRKPRLATGINTPSLAIMIGEAAIGGLPGD